MNKQMNSESDNLHLRDLETEKFYFSDYLNFGYKRYSLFIETIKQRYEKSNYMERKLLFMEVNSFYSKTMDDFGAYCLALYKARHNGISLIRTLVTFRLQEGELYKLINGKSDREIELMFGFNNIYKKKLNVPISKRKSFLSDFFKNIKLIAASQYDNNKLYNKAKHGNLIVSSIKAIRPENEDKRDSIAVLNDDFRFPNVVPFSDEEFFAKCENIIIISELILEIICVYLIRFNPEVAEILNIKKFE